MEKRKAEDTEGALVKRAKEGDGSLALTKTAAASGGGTLMKTIQRTSSLKSPIMLLTGHQAEVFTCKFSPSGQQIASGSMDRMIYLWNTYGECENYNTLKGHTGAILEVQWSRDGTNIYSASTDKTIGVWDAVTSERIKRLKGHTSFVNSVSSTRRGQELLATASDDCTARIWDPRQKSPVHILEDKYQLTAVAWSDDSNTVFTGGLDNEIKAWDMRKPGTIGYRLPGHLDTISGLRVSPDGGYLLSDAMDNTVRIWDIKPFAVGGSRLLKILEGAPHGPEKQLLKPCWSSDGDFVAAGAADRSVVIWDVATRRIVYKLPGHKGCVNEVAWHPKEPIILSGSNDKTMFLGEVNPTEVKQAAAGL
ncbi:hypothetical protein HDU76_008642 [Blyttiomyces sp. JEL0837]|nr:hypothetical protein HDU76_008642 [Blyttiomyces sp. JEL0837]